jgi:hypothetical protein
VRHGAAWAFERGMPAETGTGLNCCVPAGRMTNLEQENDRLKLSPMEPGVWFHGRQCVDCSHDRNK